MPDNFVKEKIIRGIPVSQGFAIETVIKKSSDLSYSKYNIPTHEVNNEISRLDNAVKNSVLDLGKIIKIKDHKNDIYREMKFVGGEHLHNIVVILSYRCKKKIKSDLINAEFAVIEELNKHSKIFKK